MAVEHEGICVIIQLVLGKRASFQKAIISLDEHGAVLNDVRCDLEHFLLREELLALHVIVMHLHRSPLLFEVDDGVLEGLQRDHKPSFSLDSGLIAILIEDIIILLEVINLLVELGRDKHFRTGVVVMIVTDPALAQGITL